MVRALVSDSWDACGHRLFGGSWELPPTTVQKLSDGKAQLPLAVLLGRRHSVRR